VAVRVACQDKIAHDIGAHIVDQLILRDEFAAPGAHFALLAALDQSHELVEDHVYRLRIVPERLQAAGDGLCLDDVVGAQDVDQVVEAALELVDVIGDVG